MSSIAAKAAEKRTDEIREIRKRECNKVCFDCGERGPQSVCINFGTFVCLVCHGIHREFQHNAKSISMATFDDNDVKVMREGGNDIARTIWRARYKENEFVIPDQNESRQIREKRIREFIRLTYIDRRWHKDTGKKATTPSAAASSKPEKKKKKKKVVESSSSEDDSSSSSDDSSSDEEVPAPKKKKKAKAVAPPPPVIEEKKSKKSSKQRDTSPTPPLKALTDVLPDIGALVVKPALRFDSDEEDLPAKSSNKKKKEKKSKKEKSAPVAAPAPPRSSVPVASASILDFNYDGPAASTSGGGDDWASFDSVPSSSSTSHQNHSHNHVPAHPTASHAPAHHQPTVNGNDWATGGWDAFGNESTQVPPASSTAFYNPNQHHQPQQSPQQQPAVTFFPTTQPATPTQPTRAAKPTPAAAPVESDPFAELMGSESNSNGSNHGNGNGNGNGNHANSAAPLSMFPPTTPPSSLAASTPFAGGMFPATTPMSMPPMNGGGGMPGMMPAMPTMPMPMQPMMPGQPMNPQQLQQLQMQYMMQMQQMQWMMQQHQRATQGGGGATTPGGSGGAAPMTNFMMPMMPMGGAGMPPNGMMMNGGGAGTGGSNPGTPGGMTNFGAVPASAAAASTPKPNPFADLF